jgi:hypothetical protein
MVNDDLTNDDLNNQETSGETESGSSLLVAVEGAILAIQKTLITDGVGKVSLTDLARLLQLRKELEGERPRRVNVRWIDECKTSTD